MADFAVEVNAANVAAVAARIALAEATHVAQPVFDQAGAVALET